MNKRGEEIVEASIVLPLTILVILSMIMAAVFLFRFELDQSEAHIGLARESAASEQILGIKRSTASYSGYIRGAASVTFSKESASRMYVISQADAIMLGKLAEGADR